MDGEHQESPLLDLSISFLGDSGSRTKHIKCSDDLGPCLHRGP